MSTTEDLIMNITEARMQGDRKRLRDLIRNCGNQGLKLWARALTAFLDGRRDEGHILMQQAAEAGCDPAMNFLGDQHRSGVLPYEKDRHKALEWYLRSAEAGNLEGMEACFKLYLGERIGFHRDLVKAHYWLEKALDAGSVALRPFEGVIVGGPTALVDLSGVDIDDFRELASEGKPDLLYGCLVDAHVNMPDAPSTEWLFTDGDTLDVLKSLDARGEADASVLLCLSTFYYGDGDDDYDDIDTIIKRALKSDNAAFLSLLADAVEECYDLSPPLMQKLTDKLAAFHDPELLQQAANLVLSNSVFSDPGGEEKDLSPKRRKREWALVEKALGWLKEGGEKGDLECAVAHAMAMISFAACNPKADKRFLDAYNECGMQKLSNLVLEGYPGAVLAIYSLSGSFMYSALSANEGIALFQRALDIMPSVEAFLVGEDDDNPDHYIQLVKIRIKLSICLAYFLQSSGDLDSAQEVLDEAITYARDACLSDEQDELFILSATLVAALQGVDAGIEKLLPLMNLGSPSLKGMLGAMMFRRGYQADIPKATKLLKCAIEDMDPLALEFVGKELVEGSLIFPRDVDAGLDMLRTSIALGNPLAAIALGSIYLRGGAVEVDEETAEKYFEAAMEIADFDITASIEEAREGVHSRQRQQSVKILPFFVKGKRPEK